MIARGGRGAAGMWGRYIHGQSRSVRMQVFIIQGDGIPWASERTRTQSRTAAGNIQYQYSKWAKGLRSVRLR
jgi:hypothetical protein